MMVLRGRTDYKVMVAEGFKALRRKIDIVVIGAASVGIIFQKPLIVLEREVVEQHSVVRDLKAFKMLLVDLGAVAEHDLVLLDFRNSPRHHSTDVALLFVDTLIANPGQDMVIAPSQAIESHLLFFHERWGNTYELLSLRQLEHLQDEDVKIEIGWARSDFRQKFS